MYQFRGSFLLLTAILSFNTAASITNNVDYDKFNSIDKCVKLLPNNGSEYELLISGFINNRKELKGEFKFTDKTSMAMKKELTKEEQDKLRPFQECLVKLIK